jgi:DHA3 family macrolide efflux protein-like MFS transporter
VFNAPIGAILQSTVPKDMQGRAFTVINSMSTGMMIPGLLLAGPLADGIGVRSIYFISGAATFVLMLASLSSRDLMNIESEKPAGKPASEAPASLA